MDVIAFDSGSVAVAVAVGAILLLIGIGMVIFRKDKGESVNSWANNLKLIIPLILAMVIVFATFGNALRAQQNSLSTEIEKNYGLVLTHEEIRALNYPLNEPSESFKAYGSFERMFPAEDGYAFNRIYLIWDEGEMLLAESETGEDFTPLEKERG